MLDLGIDLYSTMILSEQFVRKEWQGSKTFTGPPTYRTDRFLKLD
jgi:hypothetical protein